MTPMAHLPCLELQQPRAPTYQLFRVPATPVARKTYAKITHREAETHGDTPLEFVASWWSARIFLASSCSLLVLGPRPRFGDSLVSFLATGPCTCQTLFDGASFSSSSFYNSPCRATCSLLLRRGRRLCSDFQLYPIRT
jgi:hypothetical protein